MNTMYALLLTAILGQTMYCSDITSTTEPSSESVEPDQREDRLTHFFVKSLLYNHATQSSTEENGQRVARWELALQKNATNDEQAHVFEFSQHCVLSDLDENDKNTISLRAQFSQKATQEALQGIPVLKIAGAGTAARMSDTFTQCIVQPKNDSIEEEEEGQADWLCTTNISKKDLLEIIRNVKQNNQ